MDKRLLRLLVDQVEAVVKNQPPSADSLLALLRIASPDLSTGDVYVERRRHAAFKSLQGFIHPDKYAAAFGGNGDSDELKQVTRLFQDTCDFYNLCCDEVNSSSSSVEGRSNGRNYHISNDRIDLSPPTEREQEQERSLVSSEPITTLTVAEERKSQEMSHSQESLRHIYEASQTKPDPPAYSSTSTSSVSRDAHRSLSPVRTAMDDPRHDDHHRSCGTDRRRPSSSSPKRPPQQTKKQQCSILDAFEMTGKLPTSFSTYDAWPFLVHDEFVAMPNKNIRYSNSEIAWSMACCCLNMRGGILHGQRLGGGKGRGYFQPTHNSKLLDQYSSVPQVMEHFGFVAQQDLFRRHKDIQRELIRNGPVVSTSFLLSRACFESHSQMFSHSQVNQHVPLLIIGWSVTSRGEMWKVQSFYDRNKGIFHLGFGQWQIDQTVVAPPKATLECVPWQSPGPYLDLYMPSIGSGKDWRQSQSLGINITGSELETLSHILENGGRSGLKTAIARQTYFVIRDQNHKGYSRRYRLQDVSHVGGSQNKWKIVVGRVDLKHESSPPYVDSRALVSHPPKNHERRQQNKLLEV